MILASYMAHKFYLTLQYVSLYTSHLPEPFWCNIYKFSRDALKSEDTTGKIYAIFKFPSAKYVLNYFPESLTESLTKVLVTIKMEIPFLLSLKLSEFRIRAD